MKYLPVFINLKDQPCLVVGGDERAFTQISLLLKAGSKVHVIAPTICQGINRLKEAGDIGFSSDPFTSDAIDNQRLVVVSTPDRDLRDLVLNAAAEKNVPVGVVGQPDQGTFTVPSIIDRSPLLIAISTGGKSPTLTRILRSRLEALLPPSYGRLTELIGASRDKVKSRLSGRLNRKEFWNKIFASPIIDTFLSGKEKEAEDALEKEIEGQEESVATQGQVCLVGAGPGDPDLLTLRALKLIQNADTIVYDRLVFPTILDYARHDAELIYVGKKSADHIVPQDQINQILVDLAKQGKMVVRLKGGDPFIFGRGGEEIEKLMEYGVDFQVVPGVTAASGCGTYAGIPLTHRDYAQHCVLVTGHMKDGTMNLNWDSLAQPNQTIVFYMGLSNVDVLSKELTAHGLPADTPAAIVQKGTTKNQKVYTGTVESLFELVTGNNIKPPALIIVGHVVKLHEKLKSALNSRVL